MKKAPTFKPKNRSPSPDRKETDQRTQFPNNCFDNRQKNLEYSKDSCDYGLTTIKKTEEKICSNLIKLKNPNLLFKDKEKLESENFELEQTVTLIKTKQEIECGAFEKLNNKKKEND